MKHVVLIAGLFFSSLVQIAQAGDHTPTWSEWLSKNTSPVSDDNAGEDYSDLASFGAAIKDAQIVLLDEQSHGEENVFALKSRLVRYLHEKHGFDVLVLESGLYDADRIWRTADAANTIRAQAPGNLFYLYANSPSMQTLFDYIQAKKSSAKPLLLSGMDSQHTGKYASQYLLDDLSDKLTKVGSTLPGDKFWPTFSALTLKLFAMNRVEPDAAVKGQYFAFIGKLKMAISPTADYFWHRIILSIENQALRYWGVKHEQRSDVMGENLKALIKYRYPGKKMIVWGHSVHLNRNGLPRSGNLGHAIAEQFKQKAYVVHFTGNKGTYYHFFNDQNTPVVRFPSKTIENYLEQQPGPYNFTNWRLLPENLRSDTTMQAAIFFYMPDGLFYIADGLTSWQRQIDGTFYLNKITSTNP